MKLENIDKSIQKQDILQGISLEVSPQRQPLLVQMVLENRLSSPS